MIIVRPSRLMSAAGTKRTLTGAVRQSGGGGKSRLSAPKAHRPRVLPDSLMSEVEWYPPHGVMRSARHSVKGH